MEQWSVGVLKKDRRYGDISLLHNSITPTLPLDILSGSEE
jgi:hypothetical protein